MNVEIIKSFMKDKLSITCAYFSNTFFIILFFYLYTDGKTPLIYPIIVSLFIFTMFIGVEFYKYAMFNSNIYKVVDNPNYSLNAYTIEERKINTALYRIHRKYINKINSIYDYTDNRNKLLSQWIHNIKTPVSVIDIILQELKEKRKIENHDFNELKQQNNRILDNLEQILNMVRIDDFSKDYIPETVELCNCLKKVINKKKSEFIYNKVFPKLLYDYDNIKIVSDSKWNEFIINQIVNNSIKYSRQQTMSSKKDDTKYVYFNIEKEDKHVILTIRDEGIGIPEYDLKKVFEPFFTGENGRKIKNSTGIGLYVCKVTAEKLGHEISITSKIGEGTTVKMKYLSKL